MQIETWPLTEMLAASYNPRQDLKPGDPEYERQKKLVDAIRAGNYYETACTYAGIEYQTFRN